MVTDGRNIQALYSLECQHSWYVPVKMNKVKR